MHHTIRLDNGEHMYVPKNKKEQRLFRRGTSKSGAFVALVPAVGMVPFHERKYSNSSLYLPLSGRNASQCWNNSLANSCRAKKAKNSPTLQKGKWGSKRNQQQISSNTHFCNRSGESINQSIEVEGLTINPVTTPCGGVVGTHGRDSAADRRYHDEVR